jgi:hypothetical protein
MRYVHMHQLLVSVNLRTGRGIPPYPRPPL